MVNYPKPAIATSLSTNPAPCVTSDGRSLELVQSNSGEELTKTETKTQSPREKKNTNPLDGISLKIL